LGRLASEQSYALGTRNKEARLSDEAANGDILWVVTPAALTPVPQSTAWTRTVDIQAQNAAGEIHTWLNVAIASGVSVGDTSTAGTASIVSTTLTIVNGKAEVVVSGDAQDWLNAETDTLTVTEYTGFSGGTMAVKTSVETWTT
jgi:hypothetical protein